MSVRWHLFHRFLFVCLFFRHIDVIITLLHYILFVALLIPFSYEDKRLAHHWTTHNWRIHWPVVFMTQNQGHSQYEARRGNCLVLFSSATNFCTFCSTIRLTSILINIQVATENTINFDVSHYYNYKHSNNL